jgi:hypothetical protein
VGKATLARLEDQEDRERYTIQLLVLHNLFLPFVGKNRRIFTAVKPAVDIARVLQLDDEELGLWAEDAVPLGVLIDWCGVRDALEWYRACHVSPTGRRARK